MGGTQGEGIQRGTWWGVAARGGTAARGAWGQGGQRVWQCGGGGLGAGGGGWTLWYPPYPPSLAHEYLFPPLRYLSIPPNGEICIFLVIANCGGSRWALALIEKVFCHIADIELPGAGRTETLRTKKLR